MKQIKILLFTVVASLMFIGCGNNSKTPSEIAEKVLTAAKNLDFKILKQSVTETYIARLERLEKEMTEDIEQANRMKNIFENVTFKIISETISQDGNSAVITIEVFNPDEGEDTFEKDIHLVKINGEWKVDDDPL